MHPNLHARLERFHQEYDDPYAPHVADLAGLAGECLTWVFGSEFSTAMWQMHERLFGRPREDGPWIASAMTIDDLGKTELSRVLARLHAFAYYGIVLGEDGRFVHLVEFGGPFSYYTSILEGAPASWTGSELVEQTLLAAQTRQELDGLGFTPADHPAVWPEGVALLARISFKTMKNLLTPSSGVDLKARPDGMIPIEDARRWLAGRSEYLPSVWQLVEEGASAEAPLTALEDCELEDILFVPVAKDGSVFSPDLARNGSYTIGRKGAEVEEHDYRKALDRLTRMPRPRWRRPNDNGHWGIVVGGGWVRKPAVELGL